MVTIRWEQVQLFNKLDGLDENLTKLLNLWPAGQKWPRRLSVKAHEKVLILKQALQF